MADCPRAGPRYDASAAILLGVIAV